MSKNIVQVYQDNPITTNQPADLMYFGRSPYGLGDDVAMQFLDFAAQFGKPYTASPLTKVDDSNVTLTLGGTPTTALLKPVTLTLGWSGLLAITRGGTGVGSVTTVPTATAFAGWDANSNLSASNFLTGTTLVTNSGGTTILTVASTGQYIFSGATFETVQMPVVATLATGQAYRLVNDSSNAIFVVSSGSNAIVTMQPLTSAVLTFNGIAATDETSWSIDYTSNTIGVQSATGTLNQIDVSSPTGNITLSLASNAVLPGTGGVTLPQGTTAQQAGIAGTIRFNTQTLVFEGTLDGATWTTFSTGGSSVTSVSGTANRITSTGGTTPVIDIAATYVGQTSITTLGTIATGTWNGTIIGPTYGGTGINNGTKTIDLGSPTIGYVLTSDASGNATWQPVTGSGTVNSGLINQVAWYAASGTAVSGLPTANNGVLVTSAGGVPSISTTLPNGLAMGTPASLTLTNATGLPVGGISATGTPSSSTFLRGDGTWATSATVTPAAMTKADDTNVTITLGGTPATSLLQAVSLTMGWTGLLSPARGGTGVNNGTNTLTLGGNLTTSGAFASTFTMTGVTTVTFPTSGTLATTSQLPTPAALTKTDDTNVTLTLGGTPATALLQAASLTLGWTGTLAVGRGGTGLGSTPTNGQLLIGNGTNYTLATLTAGSGISIANSAGAITISGTGSGIGWTEVTGTSQAAVADSGYVTNNAGLVTVTLPTTAAFGTAISIIGKGAGGWSLAQNSGQNIQIGNVSSTVGAGGSVSSTNQFDSIDLLCTTANTTWTVQGGAQTSGFTIV